VFPAGRKPPERATQARPRQGHPQGQNLQQRNRRDSLRPSSAYGRQAPTSMDAAEYNHCVLGLIFLKIHLRESFEEAIASKLLARRPF